MKYLNQYRGFYNRLVSHVGFVYKDGTTSGPVGGQSPLEAPSKTPEQQLSNDVAAKKKQYESNKSELRKKIIDANSGNQPDAVKKAAAVADAELKKLIGKEASFDVSPNLISNNLNAINKILDYFEKYPQLENLHKEIAAEKAKQLKKIEDIYGKYLKDQQTEYPDLSQTAKTKLADMNRLKKEESISTLDLLANENLKPTLSDCLADDGFMDSNITALKTSLTTMTDGPDELADIFQEYRLESAAVILVEIAKDKEKLKREVAAFCAPARTQLASDAGRLAQVDAIEKSTYAAIDILAKPEDYKKRAIVAANANTQIIKLLNTPTSGDSTDSQKLLISQYNDFYLMSVVAESGYKMDRYEKSFLAGGLIGPLVGDLPGEGGELKVRDVYSTTGNPSFRMEGMGIKINSLPPQSTVRLIDEYVYHVETKNGEKVRYAKVQLNPPGGPVGYISVNNLDWRSGTPDDNLDSQDQSVPTSEVTPADKTASGKSKAGDKPRVINTRKVVITSFLPSEIVRVTDAELAKITPTEISNVRQLNASNIAALIKGGPGTVLSIKINDNQSVRIAKNDAWTYYFEDNPFITYDIDPAIAAAIAMFRGREKNPQAPKGADKKA